MHPPKEFSDSKEAQEAETIAIGNKRQFPSSTGRGGAIKARKKQKVSKLKDGVGDTVLLKDVEALLLSVSERRQKLQSNGGNNLEGTQLQQIVEPFTEVELEVSALSSAGDGLALSPELNRVYVVPFSLPGDRVVARVVKHFETHTLSDFVRVIDPSADRDETLVFCKYFGECSGCQFQMMPYERQLELKRKTIVKAFANFSGLPSEVLPQVEPVISSPLVRGYRTKLTPHFDRPRRVSTGKDDKIPDIGFQKKGRRFVLDIEDCPIGTDVLRKGWKERRDYIRQNFTTYKRGATILLRESTIRKCAKDDQSGQTTNVLPYVEEKHYVTDHNQECTEYIGNYVFTSLAGSFFQNNNSILVNFTDYVRQKLHAPFGSGHGSTTVPKFLVDAYCGSGLFSITCGSSFEGIVGVDISEGSIEFARRNADRNKIQNAKFITGNAEDIFEHIKFDPNQTSIVIDPPRKGCDESFLRQLIDLGPKRIVYISCNVHTQARDIGWILSESSKGKEYKIVSLGGFDFFPQTYHVEGCAVLEKI